MGMRYSSKGIEDRSLGAQESVLKSRKAWMVEIYCSPLRRMSISW